MNQLDNSAYESSYLNIDKDLKKRKKQIFQTHFLFAVLLFLDLFIMVLYFALPAFRVNNMKIQGLVYLTKQQYFDLADINGSSSLLFFDANEAYEHATEKADFLILEGGTSYSNPVFSETKLIENRPLFKHHNEIYFADGESYSEIRPKVADLGSDYLNYYDDKVINDHNFPLIHLPSNLGLSNYLDDISTPLFLADSEVLNSFYDVVFKTSDNSNANIIDSNDIDVIFLTGKEKFACIQSVSQNNFSTLFSGDNFSRISSRADEMISEGHASLSTYTFADTAESKECYIFEINFSGDSITMDSVKGV